ncbi:protein-export chaperone SecB [Parasediminibacterium sp. JCM 36343]|uniref:protein-export chaperone SecB n=1 Tax=Parasediminibacterium sp. JCM 36343 TaxID=3374279 RepID=UPI00397A89B7
MNKAAFSIEQYTFTKVAIDVSNFNDEELELDFSPKGVYNSQDATFVLTFNFKAFAKGEQDNPFVSIQCVGLFKFENVSSFEEIPSYFFRNSIAILFPFVRSFVSIVTIQANVPPIMLPTMNLSSLEEPLKQNTIQL